MVTLGTLGEIVPATSQKESAHGTAHCEIFLKGVTIPTNIFCILILYNNFCRNVYGTEGTYSLTPCQ